MKPTIYVHHDAYNLVGMHRAIVDTQHREEKYPRSNFGYYMFYQYFIETDGVVTHTRPDMDELVVYKSAHKNSISICFAGNFDKRLPNKAQLASFDKLVCRLAGEYGINAYNIKEHRSYQATSCPGSLIPKRYFAKRYINAELEGVKKILEKMKLAVLQLLNK